MRAINLVPADSRPGRVSGLKSGGAVFGFLGVLVFLGLGMALVAHTKRDATRAQQELAGVQQSTQAYSQVATQFSSFETAAAQATQRINTVTSLAQARFDWAGSMRELSRLIPANTQVNSLDASVRSDVQIGSGGSGLRGALDVPAIGIKGCTKTQLTAANLVTSLQAMRRVTNVTLSSSEINDKTPAGAVSASEAASAANGDTATTDSGSSSGAADDTCSLKGHYYNFDITIFFAPGDSQSSENVAPSTTPASGAAGIGTETAGATVPAASTTPTSGN